MDFVFLGGIHRRVKKTVPQMGKFGASATHFFFIQDCHSTVVFCPSYVELIEYSLQTDKQNTRRDDKQIHIKPVADAQHLNSSGPWHTWETRYST